MRYKVPNDFFPGFKVLSGLKEDEVEMLAILLEELPSGFNVQEFKSAIKIDERFSDKTSISADAIFSLGGLLLDKRAEDSLAHVAQELANAFVLESDGEREQTKNLSRNLLLLFNKSDKLIKTFKAYHLLFENTRSYKQSRVISDIRMTFNDNFDEKNKTALIIHQLKLEYVSNNELKEFFISLDKNDILDLRDELNRSLEKEGCIKRDFDKINFINLK
jgi:hypothetical protein